MIVSNPKSTGVPSESHCLEQGAWVFVTCVVAAGFVTSVQRFGSVDGDIEEARKPRSSNFHFHQAGVLA